MKLNELLEALAEAIRQRRQSYVRPFDLSTVIIDTDKNQLQLDIIIHGELHFYNLDLSEVQDREY